MRQATDCRFSLRRNHALLVHLAGLALVTLSAAQHEGRVTFGGLPLPGASVTATQGEKRFCPRSRILKGPIRSLTLQTVCGQFRCRCSYSQPRRETSRSRYHPRCGIRNNSLPDDEIGKTIAQPATVATAKPNTKTPYQRTDVTAARPTAPDGATLPAASDDAASVELARRAADGLLINGSVNNGAFSPFAQLPALAITEEHNDPLYNSIWG